MMSHRSPVKSTGRAVPAIEVMTQDGDQICPEENVPNSIFVKWRTDFVLENEKRQLTSSSQFHELFLAN